MARSHRRAFVLLVAMAAVGLFACGLDVIGLAPGGDTGAVVSLDRASLDAERQDSGVAEDGSLPPATLDGGLDGGQLSCTSKVSWESSLDTDPTAGSVQRFVIRGGGAFGGTLSGGTWRSTGLALDTSPLTDFQGVTYAKVKMRALPASGVISNGATFWINVDYDDNAGSFAPVWFQLRREASAATQTGFLYTKADSSGEPVELQRFDGLPAELVTLELRVDAPANRLAFRVADRPVFVTTYAPIKNPGGANKDRFATLLGWDVEAEFDEIVVAECE
jgi:hypothetical protein